jgi:hypothetical protein
MLGSRDQQGKWFEHAGWRALLDALNGPWHTWTLQIFAFIVVSHWLEHLLQAVQIYMLGWPRQRALGALGMLYPWLVSSEWMHYAYALIMLAGLIVLLPGMFGLASVWWRVALAIQTWHHLEHALLLGQVLTMHPLFGAAVPTSLAQLLFPRVELHLFYNVVVTVPMLIAMYFHRYPSTSEVSAATCRCARLSAVLSYQGEEVRRKQGARIASTPAYERTQLEGPDTRSC